MPGLRAPSEYSQEPPRHPSLVINSKTVQEPFNTKPPRSALVSSYVTPVDLFYKRNHRPITLVDDLDSYYVTIDGLIKSPKKISMRDLCFQGSSKIQRYCYFTAVECAGNRRTAMSKVRKVRGVGWDISAIANDSFVLSIEFRRGFRTLNGIDYLLDNRGITRTVEYFQETAGEVSIHSYQYFGQSRKHEYSSKAHACTSCWCTSTIACCQVLR